MDIRAAPLSIFFIWNEKKEKIRKQATKGHERRKKEERKKEERRKTKEKRRKEERKKTEERRKKEQERRKQKEEERKKERRKKKKRKEESGAPFRAQSPREDARENRAYIRICQRSPARVPPGLFAVQAQVTPPDQVLIG